MRTSSPEKRTRRHIGDKSWGEAVNPLFDLMNILVPDMDNGATVEVVMGTILRLSDTHEGVAVQKTLEFSSGDHPWYQPGTWVCINNICTDRSRVCIPDTERCHCSRLCMEIKKTGGGLLAVRI